METFVATAVAIALLMTAMGIGVIVSGRRLRGSCGGTGEDCECSLADRKACKLKQHAASHSG